MKKYLISLAKDQHRRELFFRQPDSQDFVVFDAINTMNSDVEQLAQRFQLAHFQQRYQRVATKGEIGCTLSHLAVYQQIVNDESIGEQEYSLICEDDALFIANFQQNLTACLPHLHGDIVLVGQSKIATFNHYELELTYPTTFRFLQKKIAETEHRVVYPYKHYYAGTVAYLIKKSTARQLLQQADNMPYWLADDFILFADKFHCDIQYIRDLLVIENPNLNSNLESIRGSVSHSLLQKLLKYPLKKLLAVKNNLGR